MVVGEKCEKDQKSNKVYHDCQLYDKFDRILNENSQYREMISKLHNYIELVEQSLNIEEERFQEACIDIESFKIIIEKQDCSSVEFQRKIAEQQEELAHLQKENEILRSKELNADIRDEQNCERLAEIMNENVLLKAQVGISVSLIISLN